MSQQSEKIAQYIAVNKEMDLGLSDDLITKVAVGLEPSIYNKDSETVSCSDKSELARVRENFLKKKLGLTQPDAELDAAIQTVCERVGTSNKNKYRAIFYALLTKNFGKMDVYA
jgi:hypothetical protein